MSLSSGLKSPGAVTVQDAIESSDAFLHTFPITCRFGDQDPLVDFFDSESRLYAFQRAADEGGPEGLAEDMDDEDEDNGFSSESDDGESVDDDFESMSGDEEVDEQAVDDEMDGGEEWVDEE